MFFIIVAIEAALVASRKLSARSGQVQRAVQQLVEWWLAEIRVVQAQPHGGLYGARKPPDCDPRWAETSGLIIPRG